MNGIMRMAGAFRWVFAHPVPAHFDALRPAPGTRFDVTAHVSSVERRRMLDYASARVSRWCELQALAVLALGVGLATVTLWAPIVAYVLFQAVEVSGLLLSRRVFFVARDPREDLSQLTRWMKVDGWLWPTAVSIGMAVCYVQAGADVRPGILAIWSLSAIAVVLQASYLGRAFSGVVAIPAVGMLATVLGVSLAAGAVDKSSVVHVVVATFTGIATILAARRLRAAYSAQLDRERVLTESVAGQRKMITKRTELIGRLSHELRTPLNGMMGLTSLLQRTALTDDQRRNLELLRTSGEHMVCLLGDSLDLSQLEVDGVRLAPASVDLARLLEEQVRLYRPTARERGLGLSLSFVDDVPALIELDATRVRQCLGNLISNAMKFSDQGEIEVEVSVDVSSQSAEVAVTVADRGIGVPADFADVIFDPYAQAGSGAGRAAQGAGLGLAITRRLARLMGGEADYEPREGGGSIFRLRFSGQIRVLSWTVDEMPAQAVG